ncbi:MAG: methionyl-tRNA formyltransferase [Balneolaceae bacterium]
MNIIFMGSPEFAIPSLEQLVNAGHNISAVVSNIDKRRGRGSETAPTPVKAKAIELGLPVIEVEDLKSPKFAEQLKELNPDLFVVVAFRVLPKAILEIPKIGSINLHASLLPKYRGAAPIHWAIINGEQQTGCTIFFLDEKVDTGNILLQKSIAVGADETTGELYKRLMVEGSQQLEKAVQLISAGDYELTSQNDADASPAPKLNKKNTRLNFSLNAQQIHNMIRGLNPFPTAWAIWKGENIKIHRSKVGPNLSIKPGELIIHDNKLLVGCNEGTIELLKIQLPGKKTITGTDFIRGYDVEGLLE